MVGDGCEVCNPAKALEYAKGTIEDLRAECDALKEQVSAGDGLIAEQNDVITKSSALNATLTARVEALERSADVLLGELRQVPGPIFFCDSGRSALEDLATVVYSTPAADLAKHDEQVKRGVVEKIAHVYPEEDYGISRHGFLRAAGIPPCTETPIQEK